MYLYEESIWKVEVDKTVVVVVIPFRVHSATLAFYLQKWKLGNRRGCERDSVKD